MNRTIALTLGMVMIFGLTVAILLAVMPGPHKPTDYLVIGCVATLLCLLLLFVVMINTPKRSDTAPRPLGSLSPPNFHRLINLLGLFQVCEFQPRQFRRRRPGRYRPAHA